MADLPPTINPFKDGFLFLEVPSLSPSPPNPKDHLSIQLANFPMLLPSSSDCENDPPIPQSIHEKLRSAFVKIKVEFGGLIQFWEPVNINGICLLITCDQPFIVGHDDKGCKEYRSCCEKYKYNIDANYKVQVDVEEDPTIISTGAPAAAFRNQLPEFPKFPAGMIVKEMSAMASSALQRGLKYSFVVPVFYPSLSSCLGVLEYRYSWSSGDVFYVFNELNTALEKVGFKTFDAQELLPYKSICGLQHAKDEIDDALTIILESPPFNSTQVWIAYEDENLSSSLQETSRTKRMLWLKLTGQCVEDTEAYEEACYRLPMKMEQVFAGKTLQNYEPRFIRDTFKSKNNEPQSLLTPYFVDCSCFMICLRSTKTGELDYVFEFLWNEIQHNDNIFELLLLILKRRLPSFKFASGAELGDELRILDVQASTKSETKYIKIFQQNQLSHVLVSVTTKRGRRPEDEECLTPLKAKCKTAKKEISLEQIKSQFGKTQKEAAQNLNVSLSTLKRKCKAEGIHEWHGKDSLNRNVNHLYKNTQSNANEDDEDNGGAIQDPSANIRETSLGENILSIKAYYADHDAFIFHLPISSATFESIEKEIKERLKLNPGDYKIKYLDEEGDWISLSSDKDMRICIQNLRDLNITKIKLRVVLLRKI